MVTNGPILPTAATPAQHILETAVELAAARSWEAVRLYEVAARVGMPLDTLRGYFPEKEDLVEAWFDRADAAMLQQAAHPDFKSWSVRARLYHLIMSWLDALAPQQRVTRQMILGKCEPGHLHVQLPGLLRISRTVQWLREAAQQDATYGARALEETVLTGIYLTTFIHWLSDTSVNMNRTRRLLDLLLAGAEVAANGLTWLRAWRPGWIP